MNRSLDFSTGSGLAAAASVSTEVRASDEVISIQVTSASPSLVYEVSNDNVNWVTGQVRPACNFGAAPSSSITAVGIYVGMIQTRYVRVRNTGGSAAFGVANIGIGWIN